MQQKAAVWYEAARRRPEVQKAWLKGQFLFCANGWQYFTGRVVNNLLKSWPELDDMTKHGIIKSSYSQWSVPPAGYSTFPENPERAPGKLKGGKRKQWEVETKERREAAAKRCQQVAMQLLHLPEAFESFDHAKKYLQYMRKFVDAGFEIVAVDNKTKQGIRYACKAIEALKRSVRKADVKKVILHHLPPDISDADNGYGFERRQWT